MVYGFVNSPTAWAVIVMAVLLLFGGKNLPEMMKGLGQGMREFKKGMESDEPVHSSADEERAARRRAEIEEEVRLRVEAERRRNREKADTQEGSP